MDLSATFQALLKVRDEVARASTYQGRDLEFLSFVTKNIRQSNAQLFQDLWVLFELGEKRNGFFVEFGACDGLRVSNSLLLEKVYGWNGVLAEPARSWHEDLLKNRSCFITRKCVYKSSGKTLEFYETDIQELSTIDTFTQSDFQGEHRKGGSKYPVETISLRDLLQSARAPREIDYLSMDTEGSELEILESFDLAEYDIKLISVEHNFSSTRTAIFDRLVQAGYKRVFQQFSLWDDWYIKTS